MADIHRMGKFAFVALAMLVLIGLLPYSSSSQNRDDFLAQTITTVVDPIPACLMSCDEAARTGMMNCEALTDPVQADACRQRIAQNLPLCHQRCTSTTPVPPPPPPGPLPPPSPLPPPTPLPPSGPNAAPLCFSDDIGLKRTAVVDQKTVFSFKTTDPNGDVLTYTLTQGGTGMAVSASTGQLTWTPITSQIGKTFVVQVRVADPKGLSCVSSASFEVADSQINITCKEQCNVEANKVLNSFPAGTQDKLRFGSAQAAYTSCYSNCTKLSKATTVDPNEGLEEGEQFVGTRCTMECNNKKTTVWDKACSLFDSACKQQAQSLYGQCLQACTEVGPLSGAEGEVILPGTGTYIPAARECAKYDESGECVPEVRILAPGGKALFYAQDEVPAPEELKVIFEKIIKETPRPSPAQPSAAPPPAPGSPATSPSGSTVTISKNTTPDVSLIGGIWGNIVDFVGGIFGGGSNEEDAANVAQPVNSCVGGGSPITRNTPMNVKVTVKEPGGNYYVGSSGQIAQDIDRGGAWAPMQIAAVVQAVNAKCKAELKKQMLEKAQSVADGYCTQRCTSDYSLAEENIRGCDLDTQSQPANVNVASPGTANQVWVAWNEVSPRYWAQVTGYYSAKITVWCPREKYTPTLPTGTAPPPPPTYQLNQVKLIIDVKTKDGAAAVGWSDAYLKPGGYAAFLSRTQYIKEGAPVDEMLRKAINDKKLPGIAYSVNYLHARDNGIYYEMDSSGKEVEKKYWGPNPGISVHIVNAATGIVIKENTSLNPTTYGTTLSAQQEWLIGLIKSMLDDANVKYSS